jgi:hypothetical protein
VHQASPTASFLFGKRRRRPSCGASCTPKQAGSPAAYIYEQAFLVMRQLGLLASQVEQQFHRMVFNVVVRNQDDHVKNIDFLMDRSGTWRLSPAYDVAWAYKATDDWTSKHQMSINHIRDNFVACDLLATVQTAGVSTAKPTPSSPRSIRRCRTG